MDESMWEQIGAGSHSSESGTTSSVEEKSIKDMNKEEVAHELSEIGKKILGKQELDTALSARRDELIARRDFLE